MNEYTCVGIFAKYNLSHIPSCLAVFLTYELSFPGGITFFFPSVICKKV